jgi:hypothetical protein
MRASNELNALGSHQIGAPLNHSFFQLHVGYAVHQQTTHPVGPFENGNPMTRAIKLRRAGKAGWTRADHGDLFPGAHRRRFGNHPARLKTFVNYRLLNRLDRDREITDTKYTRTFAWRGTNSARKFRKVVGVVKATKRFAPMPPVDQIVPLRNQIVYRTPGSRTTYYSAGMAKRHSAIHATRALFAQGFLRRMQMEFPPVRDALRW